MAGDGRFGPRIAVTLLVIVAGIASAHPGLAQTAAGSWTQVAPIPTARFNLTAATGLDGRIYTFGGFCQVSCNGFPRVVEAYDPSTNKWVCSVGDAPPDCASKRIAPMPAGGGSPAATTGRDGKIYVVGLGDCAPAPQCPSDLVEVYDPSTNTWACSVDDPSSGCSSRTIASVPTARRLAAMVTESDGKIYVIGGGTDHGPVNTVEVYDPTTNKWACSVRDTLPGCSSTTIAPLPGARGGLVAALGPDNRIYAVGGCSVTGCVVTGEIYDPSTNRWTPFAPMPTARYSFAGAASGGRLYVLGGCFITTGCPGTLAVEACDPSTAIWTSVAPMPEHHFQFAAAAGRDGRIYAIGGGTDFSESPNGVQAYTPSLAPVTTVTGPPTLSLPPTPPPPPPPVPTATGNPSVHAEPAVTAAASTAGVAASFTVTFASEQPGQGEVYFGSGPGCQGLVEVATEDLHPGTTQHAVVVTGNDLPGSVGNNGVVPGTTYWFEAVTVTRTGVNIDNNGGRCFSVTIPSR